MFDFNGCVDVTFERLARLIDTVDTKYTRFSNIASENIICDSDIFNGQQLIDCELFVKSGDQVKQFDDICEVQSDKASVTITNRYDGLIKTLHYKIDNVALVGSTLLDFEIEDNSTDVVRNDAGEIAKSAENQTIDNSEKSERRSDKVESENITLKEEKVLSTPVKRIAKENNIKLTDVKATDKNRRVLKEDILAHLQKISADPRVKTIPHFIYSDECNMDQVMRYRNDVKDSLMERGISLILMTFFIKAASRALQQYP
ncbi:Lipoamide acyltransferase component of branched-chain alpha-keto acid dehydrogenase complex, mitochondrial [Acromyrmex echinatior]|uniref:Dihydrolipoamide acetyltransferase component of pyruvate dehydrogenase complex n=1 Tax=Acromyrmex echinatior TaxID=103372 RepID=F4W7Q9_ACREC|nr:Lipoamide acyltransferase component of branched-chain alpha-keto acid dehydrogenase complex, mitochondrial [Acromyrmex echinatior]